MDNYELRPGTIFITGISASGKSTYGRALKEDLLNNNINNVQLIDGENVREDLARRGKRYGYSTQERNEVALEMAHMAVEYNRKGIICIVCSICHVKAMRQQMRAIIVDFMEVYLDCPVNICAKRDYKGNYIKAFQGLYDNFVGVTEPYQKSDHVELVLQTGRDSIEKCSQVLFASVKDFLKEQKKRTARDINDIKQAIEADKK